MAKSKTEAKDKNLNITISSTEEDKDVIISISTLLKKLKKYLVIWIVTAVVCFGASFGYAGITTHVQKPTLVALVGFSYDGIEKGLDPNGRDFKVETLKNPAVIEAALTELDINLDQLEYVRQGITIKGITPKDIVSRLTQYEMVVDKNGNINAAERILDTTYFPTQYKVLFNYSHTSLTDDEAVLVLNTMLEKYKNYFYETYGYNESLGSAVRVLNYEDYDYSEAVEVFSSSLTTLSSYVNALSKDDTTKFRSSTTGYSFADLSRAIKTVKDIDIDKVSSYITVNNLTKDKEAALAYCEYRIKSLNRTKARYEEQLDSYNEAIESYVKDEIIVFGENTNTVNTQSTIASEQYDRMFRERNDIIASLTQTKQDINYYKERQESLKGKNTGSKAMVEKVEADLTELNERINELTDLVSATADDYYVNVTFKNAYTVLAPASDVSTNRTDRIKENIKKPFIILEGLAFVVYFAAAFIEAIVSDSRKKKYAEVLADGETSEGEASESETPDEADGENSDSKAEETAPEEAEDKDGDKKKKKK